MNFKKITALLCATIILALNFVVPFSVFADDLDFDSTVTFGKYPNEFYDLKLSTLDSVSLGSLNTFKDKVKSGKVIHTRFYSYAEQNYSDFVSSLGNLDDIGCLSYVYPISNDEFQLRYIFFKNTTKITYFCKTQNVNSKTVKYSYLSIDGDFLDLFTSFEIKNDDIKFSNLTFLYFRNSDSNFNISNNFYSFDNIGSPEFLYSSTDIVNENGENVFVAPEQWKYNVKFEPTINDNMETETLKCTVSLTDSCKKYCDINKIHFDIFPYISKNNLSDDDLVLSFDNAISCFPYLSYYYDDTIKSYKFNDHTGKLNLEFEKTYGNNIIYSLNTDNNYTVSFELDIKNTSLVSNTDYYFCILGSQWENTVASVFLFDGYENLPNRYYFKEIYEKGLILPNVDSFKILCSEHFILASVSKKNSRNNDVGTGGIIIGSSNSLNSDYKFTSKFNDNTNYLTKSESDDLNLKNEENYLEQTNSSSYDITSLDNLFNSCSQFFNFIKHGYTILPNSIWLLIDGFIVVIIYLRIMGR